MLLKYYHRLCFIFHRKGIWPAAQFLLSRLIFRMLVTLLYEIDLTHYTEPKPNLDHGVKLLIFARQNANEITPEIKEFLGDDQLFLDGLAQKDVLFVLERDGQYANFGFIVYETRQSKILDVEPGIPILCNDFTHPNFRGQGLHVVSLKLRLDWLRDQKTATALIEVHPKNYASQKGIEKAGFTFVKKVYAFIFFFKFALLAVGKKGITYKAKII